MYTFVSLCHAAPRRNATGVNEPESWVRVFDVDLSDLLVVTSNLLIAYQSWELSDPQTDRTWDLP